LAGLCGPATTRNWLCEQGCHHRPERRCLGAVGWLRGAAPSRRLPALASRVAARAPPARSGRQGGDGRGPRWWRARFRRPSSTVLCAGLSAYLVYAGYLRGLVSAPEQRRRVPLLRSDMARTWAQEEQRMMPRNDLRAGVERAPLFGFFF